MNPAFKTDVKTLHAQIPRQGQAEVPPFSYADLRERGIAFAQALSGHLWTDFNHHDPGVTLLEALCFALTEGIFTAETPIADLLTRQDGRIHYRRHGLHAAEEILPCRPTTKHDLLRWIYDRVPQIRHLRLNMLEDAERGPCGIWQMALRVSAEHATLATASAMRAYWAQRNLCEDLPAMPQVITPRWCRLHLAISIEGPRELSDILVELVQRSAEYISAAPLRQSLMARNGPGDGSSPDKLFEGPPLRNGWIADASLQSEPSNRLHFSDLACVLETIDGVAGVQHLRLESPDLTEEDGALQWHDESWALELRWPDTAEDLKDWCVARRGSRVNIDAQALLCRLADDRHVSRSVMGMQLAGAECVSNLPRPMGQLMEHFGYHAAYHQLPSIYHEAHAGTSPLGNDGARAQFIAYHALLEQWLAHGEAQSQNLQELYTIDAGVSQSYWWQMLDGEHLPGLDSLYVEGSAGLRQSQAAFAAADEVLERRSRVLDHLLALHGESCSYASMRAYGWYFGQLEWIAHLFECKRQWLLRIVNQTRNRSGGFDYSRVSLGRKGNTSALHERICLLLGMARLHSRLLIEPLRRFGVGLASAASISGRVVDAPADIVPLPMWIPLRARINAQLDDDLLNGRVVARLGHYFPNVPWRALPPALLRCGVHADHYGVSANTPAGPLWLGPDEDGLWWPLAVTAAPGSPGAPALYLHELLCRMQRECEGLHVIEHVLLRPVVLQGAGETTEASPIPETFYAYRLTVVFSGWTARGTCKAFRDIAAETVALSCPAHIMADVVWPNAEMLWSFEQVYEAWLDARQAYCASLCGQSSENSEDIIERLNLHANTLSRWLISMHGDVGGKT